MKFKVGDRVKVLDALIDTHLIGKTVKVVGVYGGRVYLEGAKSNWYQGSTKLKKLGGSMESVQDLQVGDILVNEDDDKKKVLGVCGLVAFLSNSDYFDVFSDGYTIEEIKSYGWKLKTEEETKEMTVAEISEELGYQVKVVK